MYQCLLIYKSLTNAQRAERLLRSNCICTQMTRPPRDLVSASCSYAVKISMDDMGNAMFILRNSGISPDRVLTDFGGPDERAGY